MNDDKNKKAYPRDYSDKELKDKIDHYGDKVVNEPDNLNYFTKATLGLAELNGRISTRIGIVSVITGITAVIIACLALYKSSSL
jgi:hypothetical protein